MKIKQWSDLKDLENGRGLKVETKTLEGYDKYCDIIIKDTEYPSYLPFNLGEYRKNQLKGVIDVLRKHGFDIEYDTFNLVDFLKEHLKPKQFESGGSNYYFLYSHKSKDIGFAIGYDYESIETIYFENINILIIEKFNEENITIAQLRQSFKELGWTN